MAETGRQVYKTAATATSVGMISRDSSRCQITGHGRTTFDATTAMSVATLKETADMGET